MSVSITWDQLAIFGIFVAYLLSALIYMLSHMLGSELLRAWARHEIQSLFLTLILFASLASLAGQPFIKKYREGALEYLNALYDDAVYCQFSMIKGIGMLSILSSISINVNPSIFNLKGSPSEAGDPKSGQDQSKTESEKQVQKVERSISAGISLGSVLQPLIITFSDLQGFLFIPFTLLQFHTQLLSIVASKGASLLLPLGIFLRAFKFTRHGGNLLIALFIALYFILPAMYLFNKGLMQEKFDLKDMRVCENKDPGLISEFAGPVMAEAGFLQFGGIHQTGELAKLLIAKAENLSYGGSSFSIIFLRVGIESAILPMFAIIVALGLAREFAQLLGSDVDFSQLVRVV